MSIIPGFAMDKGLKTFSVSTTSSLQSDFFGVSIRDGLISKEESKDHVEPKILFLTAI